jgi:hypothetical protein
MMKAIQRQCIQRKSTKTLKQHQSMFSSKHCNNFVETYSLGCRSKKKGLVFSCIKKIFPSNSPNPSLSLDLSSIRDILLMLKGYLKRKILQDDLFARRKGIVPPNVSIKTKTKFAKKSQLT